jgi:YVTN family beta-propeller protein
MRRTTGLGGAAASSVLALAAACSSTPPVSPPSTPVHAQAKAQRTNQPEHAQRGIGLRVPLRAPHLHPPSDRRLLTLARSIEGNISPKSVAAGPRGLVFAQNMMYRHTVTVYRAGGRLVKTIPDSVRLSAYGIDGHPGLSSGAPVEAAADPDGRHVYVSNYSMYGAGFGPEGSDICSPRSAASDGVSPSYVYRIDVRSLRIDDVYPVGLVPKFLTVTPNGKFLLVSNWCSYRVSVVRISTGREVGTVWVGAYPRGLAVTRDSSTAYVAVMGSTEVAVVDLRHLKVRHRVYVGNGPRHLILDPHGRFLYVTLNGEGSVVKVDRHTGRVVDRVFTGRDPRTMAMAPDGRTLYVVNYLSDTVSVVRTSDMVVLQTIATGDEPVPSHPIGVTYNPHGNRVWVALYSGKILVFDTR